jgi:hypothetical protein
MGIAIKYVKDKGECGSGGGGGNPPTQQGLLPIERDFYDRLQLQIFFSGNTNGLPLDLRNRLESLLRKSSTGMSSALTELAPDFKYIYTNEAFIGDSDTFKFDTDAANRSHSIKIIRISFRVCTITEAAAFLVFHFTTEYVSLDGNLWRDDGECVQTWHLNEGEWFMIGEYMDGVHMELQGKKL